MKSITLYRDMLGNRKFLLQHISYQQTSNKQTQMKRKFLPNDLVEKSVIWAVIWNRAEISYSLL